jgi:hypothetical protein
MEHSVSVEPRDPLACLSTLATSISLASLDLRPCSALSRSQHLLRFPALKYAPPTPPSPLGAARLMHFPGGQHF